MQNYKILIIISFIIAPIAFGQNEGAFQIARLQYDGGGDWYNGQTEEPNLLDFIKSNTNIKVNDDFISVNINSDAIFSYPFLCMT